MPGQSKKFITLAGTDICKNEWHIIHGVSRTAYCNYKAAAIRGFCNGSYGNAGIPRVRAQTIQAEANLMTIINDNVDQMPNRFRCIGSN
jgi:hypothetical protein